MAIKYKQLCSKCKSQYVNVRTFKQQYLVCYDCQKDDLKGEVKDPEMKKLFDIPDDYYKENTFLGNIKINYLRFQNLSEKQIEAFKKAVNNITEERNALKK